MLEPGVYIVAVSGGVDSMSLLHMLATVYADKKDVSFVVAHYDHGIRADSDTDRKHVAQVAKTYGLPFVYEAGSLGEAASEQVARHARYDFLRRVQAAAQARAIITAHHQDDLLETAVLNVLRGTARKGISSLQDRPELRRPLLGVSKADIYNYAKEQGLAWREDATNADTKIARNYLRHRVLARLNADQKKQLLSHVTHITMLNRLIDEELMRYLHVQPSRQTLDRHQFIMLPHIVAREVMAAWLRSHGIREFDKRMLEKLVIAAKTLQPGKVTDVNRLAYMHVGNEVLALIIRDR